MNDPLATISAFFETWSEGKEAIRRSMRDHLASDAVWENVGLTRTVGPEEAIQCFFGFESLYDYERIEVDMLNIAAAGNVVFTERVDRLVNAAGETVMPVRAVGVMELAEDGKIASWRDYFDTVPFAAGASGEQQ